MNKILLIAISFIVGSYSCEKENLTEEKKYYDSEIFLDQNRSIYGKWNLKENSGGIIGTGKQIDADVDLEIEKFGRYRLFHDKALSEFGRLSILIQSTDSLVILFEPDDEMTFSFFDRIEKTVIIEGPDLWLTDPCCDLFQYHFRKRE